MTKALRNEPDVFLSSVDGRISAWDSSAEDVLVEAANQGLKHDFEETVLFLPEQMLFERAATIWLIRLLEKGVTARLIDELNNWTSGIRYRRLLVMNEGEDPQWHEIADLGSRLNPETRVAYAISHLIGSGAFQRLKRCEEEACEEFYLGRPNSKRCSKRCGNRARGKRKRKLDRESGILPGA